jgi:uncharacterized protein
MDIDVREPDGRAFARNLMRFGRSLRAVGLPITVQQIADATRALEWIDVGDREQVHATMRALFVTRREDLALFRLVFDSFFRHPGGDALHRPQRVPPAPRHDPVSQGRFTIATYTAYRAKLAERELDVADRSGTYTQAEQLTGKRFSELTPEELDSVARLFREMRWRMARRTTRRRRADRSGSDLDLRRVLRQTSRLGALPARLPRRRRTQKQRPVVLLADISGSMEKFSRLILQFFHSAIRALDDVETFVFATRLSRITTQLSIRNIDRAIDEASRDVIDWAGGTRIGACLHTFNRDWSRRVLRRGAVVTIISDGCDTGEPDLLRREMRWLHHRCHRLIWLNPHLGHDAYRPIVTGMAAALDWIDDFLPADNADSLAAFARLLASLPSRGRRARPHRLPRDEDRTPIVA